MTITANIKFIDELLYRITRHNRMVHQGTPPAKAGSTPLPKLIGRAQLRK